MGHLETSKLVCLSTKRIFVLGSFCEVVPFALDRLQIHTSDLLTVKTDYATTAIAGTAHSIEKARFTSWKQPSGSGIFNDKLLSDECGHWSLSQLRTRRWHMRVHFSVTRASSLCLLMDGEKRCFHPLRAREIVQTSVNNFSPPKMNQVYRYWAISSN
jgi:hypothetical protein